MGSLGKAEWLDLSIRSLGFLGLLRCKLEWEHFNLLCTGTEPKNTGNTHTGMQPQVEVEGGGAVKFMGSQTIGSSSCSPSYPPPGASFLSFKISPALLNQN